MLGLLNCGVLTEGYDDWQVACVIMARPTKSQLLFTQCVGRGTRIPDGVQNLHEAREAGAALAKEDCLLLDVVDATEHHSLITLPTLFGLNGKLDMKGKSAAKVKQELEELQAAHPTVDLSSVEDIDKVRARIEEVDLWQVKFPEEVEQNSELQWHRSSDGSYVLLLPKQESVVVWQDMLDKWNITATINGSTVMEKGIDNLAAALNFADGIIKTLGGATTYNWLRRNWSSGGVPATEPQMRLMKKLRIQHPPDITKGDASKLIGRFFNSRAIILE